MSVSLNDRAFQAQYSQGDIVQLQAHMEASYYETMYKIRDDEELAETFKKLKGPGRSRQSKAIYEAAFENI